MSNAKIGKTHFVGDIPGAKNSAEIPPRAKPFTASNEPKQKPLPKPSTPPPSHPLPDKGQQSSPIPPRPQPISPAPPHPKEK